MFAIAVYCSFATVTLRTALICLNRIGRSLMLQGGKSWEGDSIGQPHIMQMLKASDRGTPSKKDYTTHFEETKLNIPA
eukprot:3322639-Amphidinium_carterae.1